MAANKPGKAEILAAFFDDGTYSPLFTDGAVSAAYGCANGQNAYVVFEDGSPVGVQDIEKNIRVLEMAAETGAPVVTFYDSTGAKLEGGLDLVSGGTDNHLMLVDLRPARLTGKEMERRLDEVNITVNKNAIPNDPEKPFVTSGIRVGTPAVTSRGFKEEEMKVVGSLICQCAQDDFESKIDDLRAQVKALTGKYPLYTNG